MNEDPVLQLSQRVSALELAVFALCKAATDKDGLMADIDRLIGVMNAPNPSAQPHFDEIKRLLAQYREYAGIGKFLRPGQ